MKQISSSIHGPVMISFIILVVAALVSYNADAFREWWQERDKRLNQANRLSMAASLCNEAHLDARALRSECAVLLKDAKEKHDGARVAEIQEILCRADDTSACLELGLSLKDNGSERASKLFEKSCRDGLGGNMRACGLYSDFIKKTEPEKAKELSGYACRNGFKEFCEGPHPPSHLSPLNHSSTTDL
ncbi:MAG: hypothetical protein A2X86_14510 [Bdellovibrionales bacterium GWA2_49_15]|nr:MAG: hypothetical protein A2X86_14510 [Bdellovibrionales bacterium GWA2_49_15]HAZ13819.1 hypothetical protein [Bdellovibrionales bacterium]